MSRGPGRWQRVLLLALETHDVGTVAVIAYNELGREPSRAEVVAIRRAARRLAEDGRVTALHLGQCVRCGDLSEIFQCRSCGAGCNVVLAVARTDLAFRVSSVMGINGLPSWVSVAAGTSAAEATLTGPT